MQPCDIFCSGDNSQGRSRIKTGKVVFEESIGRPLNLNKGEMRNLIVKFESHAITLPINGH